MQTERLSEGGPMQVFQFCLCSVNALFVE